MPKNRGRNLLNSDIGLERLPSGYLSTNKRLMYLALLAFNLLRETFDLFTP